LYPVAAAMTGASTGYDDHHNNADEDEIAVLANLRRCMDETRSRLQENICLCR
jgi:hypothetical protein